MTQHKLQTTTITRILSALGVTSFLMVASSMGALADTAASTSDRGIDQIGTGETGVPFVGKQARMLTDINIKQEDREVTVLIAGDGNLRFESSQPDTKRLVVDFPNVTSSIRTPLGRLYHQYLKRVRLGHHADKVRLVFDLKEGAEFAIEPQGTTLLVRVHEPSAVEGHASPETKTVSATTPRQSSGATLVHRAVMSETRSSNDARMRQEKIRPAFRVRPVQMTSGQESSENQTHKDDLVLGETRYVGRRISLDFQQADISNVLRLIAEVSGFNIVIGEGVKSKVTMKLVSVPWDQALDMILKMNGLGKIKQGNILWIDSLSNISRQQDEEAKTKDSKVKAEPLVDRVFYIRNLQAQELLTALRQNLSPRGKMQVSPGSNALVVQDAESKIQVLKQLIEGLDLAVPQVQIEARIVQADTVYARGLGVQWGIKNTDFGANTFSAVGNLTGPFAPIAGTGGTTIPRDFLVNLPAQVAGLPAVPAVGYTFGKLADGFALDLRLSAGELLGLAKVIAAPKITTLDKREAKISQGESIPFQTTSLQGTQTTFVDANLELNVTPQITSRDPKEVGKQIMMKVRATRNAVGARSNPAGPSIDRREANTQVIVRDGETMVIGGVFIDTQNNNVQGVPYLSRIPVLGWLFKNKSESVSKQELLIFLTPSIVQSS
ncbi:type IV pilus secretin PilQ [Petrachloros mirabilis]